MNSTRSQRKISSEIPKETDLKINTQSANSAKDLKQCLKLLESGDIESINVDGMSEEFFSQLHLGDHLQYELHKFCRKDVQFKSNISVIAKLADLCYAGGSVSKFTNMDRFVGCVYYISDYFLKRKEYRAALSVHYSLILKKEEIIEASEKNTDIRNFLCSLHCNFMSSAVTAASQVKSESDSLYETSHGLAMAALRSLQFTNVPQFESGKKVLKTTKLYLYTIKHYRDKDISEFYGTLREILKILLPALGEHYYFYYFINKLDQIRDVNHSKESEIYQSLRRAIRLSSIMLNASSTAKSNLEAFLDSFFTSTVENDYLAHFLIEDFSKTKDSKSEFYFLLISYIFCHGIQVWWKLFESDWSKRVSVELVQKLCDGIVDFHSQYYRNESLYCRQNTVKIPFDICFGDLLMGNLHKIMYTVRLCLKNCVPNCLSLVSISRQAFKLTVQCLNFADKGCCETERSNNWKHAVIHLTNTIEDILRHSALSNSWEYLKDCSKDLICDIVNRDFDLPFHFRRLHILFQRWNQGLKQLKQYNNALFVCLIYYVCYPKMENEIMSIWIETKIESSNEIFQETTMIEALKKYESAIKEFYPKYESSCINKKSIMLMEMKAYSTCTPETFTNSKTCYNLVDRIWKQLSKVDLNVWEKSVALSCLISPNISEDDDKLAKVFKQKFDDVLRDLVDYTVYEKQQCRSLLHAANLNLSLLLYNVKKAENSERDLNSAKLVLGYLKKVEEENVKFGEDVDMNLTCSIIPSSTKLTVELETKYLKIMNEIVDLWEKAMKSGKDDLPTPAEFQTWLQNVKQVAHLYELVGEYYKSFTSWLLYYDIGKLCNDSGAVLLGLTHIIEYCSDVEGSVILKEAETLFDKLEGEYKDKYVLIQYWLAVASNYFKNSKVNQSFESLMQAKKILDGLRSTFKTIILGARFWCLASKFLSVFPSFETSFGFQPQTDFRVMVFKAFNYANAAVRSEHTKSATQDEYTELVLAMLEVNLWAFHLNGTYSQTDFMRFFLDDLYQIVQKLFLPTRTAEILVRLAEVDLVCEKTSDCQGKVTKLKSILTTLSSSLNEDCILERSESPYLPVSKQMDFDKVSPRPISPARFLNHTVDAVVNDSSPVHFQLNDVSSSKSKKHHKYCKCRLCQNILIQILTMNTLTLEAELQDMEGNSKKAAACYVQAYEVMKKLERLKTEQSESVRLELRNYFESDSEDNPDFHFRLVQFYSARFLIKYAFFESNSLQKLTSNVNNAISKVNRIMDEFSYEKKLLMWLFMELKLFTMVLSKEKRDSPVRSSTPVQYKTSTIIKTPFITTGAKTTAGKVKNKNEKMEKSPNPLIKKPVGRKIISSQVKFKDERNCYENITRTSVTNNEKMFEDKETRDIHPRKLDFLRNEPVSSNVSPNTTVLKAPAKSRTNSDKPRKLVLDDSTEEATTRSRSSKKSSSTAEKPVKESAKENVSSRVVPTRSSKKVMTSIKIHKD